MKKDNLYIGIIILLVIIGIAACIRTRDIGTTETIGNVNATYENENSENENNNSNQNTENKNENYLNENTSVEVENTKKTNTVIVYNPETFTNPSSVYETDTDMGTTDKKQEAINLVKEKWGEDSSVTFRCDSITPDGKYIIAVVSLESASVKNYFSVNLETKEVVVDY